MCLIWQTSLCSVRWDSWEACCKVGWWHIISPREGNEAFLLASPSAVSRAQIDRHTVQRLVTYHLLPSCISYKRRYWWSHFDIVTYSLQTKRSNFTKPAFVFFIVFCLFCFVCLVCFLNCIALNVNCRCTIKGASCIATIRLLRGWVVEWCHLLWWQKSCMETCSVPCLQSPTLSKVSTVSCYVVARWTLVILSNLQYSKILENVRRPTCLYWPIWLTKEDWRTARNTQMPVWE